MGGRLAALALLAAVLGLPVPLPATSSCAGPGLAVTGVRSALTSTHEQVVRLRAGAAYEVVGQAFFDGCDDTGGTSTGTGCAARREQREVSRPREDVTLSLVQGPRRVPLGTRDASPRFVVRWPVVLPVDLRPGPALLEADGARLLVVVGETPSRR